MMDFDDTCTHETHPVWTIVSGGLRQLRLQCLRCGGLIASAQRHSLATPSTPMVDKAAVERYWANRQAWYLQQGERRREEYDARREVQRQEFWERWTPYLSSPEWYEKRGQVLRRANFICEGCGINRATQVHHTTYRNIGNEFLFQLVALCRDCHERYHEVG
jgi:5-methylcytosine-specific restriction endonuclease McrA